MKLWAAHGSRAPRGEQVAGAAEEGRSSPRRQATSRAPQPLDVGQGRRRRGGRGGGHKKPWVRGRKGLKQPVRKGEAGGDETETAEERGDDRQAGRGRALRPQRHPENVSRGASAQGGAHSRPGGCPGLGVGLGSRGRDPGPWGELIPFWKGTKQVREMHRSQTTVTNHYRPSTSRELPRP